MEFHGKMANKLEQIFWRKGKFIDVNEKEVTPIMIGPSFYLNAQKDNFEKVLIDKFNRLKEESKIYEDANSYLIGTEASYMVPYTINLTKI